MDASISNAMLVVVLVRRARERTAAGVKAVAEPSMAKTNAMFLNMVEAEEGRERAV
jgi:hypothetical protein